MPNLFIDVQARFAQFQDSLNKIQGETSKFTNNLQGAFNGVRTALAGIGVGIGVGTLTTGFKKMVEAASEAEKASNRLTGTIKATGSAAGVTKTEIDDLADALAKSTQFDDESIRNAASELLIFRNVQQDVFKETLALSADVAAAMGTNIPEAAARLGRSLEDPDTAFGLLRRQGVVLEGQQKDLIKSLIETGKVAEAQRIIIDKLKGAYGGLAQEMNTGLNKSTNDVKKAWDELMESFGKTAAVSGTTQQFLRGVTGWLDDIKTVVDSGNWVEKLIGIMSGGFALKGVAEDIKKRGPAGTADTTGGDAQDAAIGASIGARRQRAAQITEAQYQTGKKREEELKKAREASGRAASSALESYQGKLRSLEGELRNVLGTETELQRVREQMAGDKDFKAIPAKQREQLRTAIEASAQQIDQAREQKKIQEENQKLLEEGNKGWVTYAEAVLDAADAENTANAALVKTPAQLTDLANSLKLTLDPLHEFKNQWADLDDLVAQGWLTDMEARLLKLPSAIRDLIKPTEEMGQQIQRLWEAGRISTEEMQAANERIIEQMGEGSKKTNDFAHAIGTAFEDAILQTKKFKDVLQGLVEDLARIALRVTVTKPLENILTQAFAGGIGGALGGGGTYGSNMTVSDSGGYRRGGELLFVGDTTGGEMWMPTTSGHVVPNSQLASGEGITLNQSFSFNGNAPNRAEVMQMVAMGGQQTVAAMGDMMRRGGNFPRMMRGR